MKRGLTIHASYHISIEMSSVREIDIQNRSYYFFDDMINIKNLDPNNIQENILIYYIGYVAPNSIKPF